MASCGADRYRAQVLSTGRLITVVDYDNIEPVIGDTVTCCKITGDWSITNYADGVDTLYVVNDSAYGSWVVEKRVVRLIRAL